MCAFNLDKAAKKHDTTVLYESSFYYRLTELLNGWLCLADTAYANEEWIAASLKRTNARRHNWSKTFWSDFTDARGDSERVFAQFFVNKFAILSNWPGKAVDTFDDWAMNVTCCVIVYNYFRKQMHLS